jgi:hypothetical protein
MHQPLSEQVQCGASISETRDALHPAALPCTRPWTPGRGAGGVEGLEVLTNARRHSSKGWSSSGLGIVEPLMEGLPISWSQHGLNPLLHLMALGQQRIGVPEAVADCALGGSQATGGGGG